VNGIEDHNESLSVDSIEESAYLEHLVHLVHGLSPELSRLLRLRGHNVLVFGCREYLRKI
jgi:hypothetical protein